MGYFDKATLAFLDDLKSNNTREWFRANKERYERDVKEPFLDFIAVAARRLRKLSQNLVADPRPVGGSLFRLHRDVRFSRDKSPYKTHAGAHFPLGGKDVHGPGFYLHLEPRSCFVAGGMWMPEAKALLSIRQRIVARSAEWSKVRGLLGDADDALKRPPRGFEPDHPMIEDIKRKSFTASRRLTNREVLGEDLMNVFIGACKEIMALMKFLAAASGVPW